MSPWALKTKKKFQGGIAILWATYNEHLYFLSTVFTPILFNPISSGFPTCHDFELCFWFSVFIGCSCKVPLPSLWLKGHAVLSQVYHISFPYTMGVNSCMSVCERKQWKQHQFSIARCSWAFLLHSQSFLHCCYLQMCWKYSLIYLQWLFFLGRRNWHPQIFWYTPSFCQWTSDYWLFFL